MKQAIFLLNMGGPRSIKEVEIFMRNMFHDPHILPMNALVRSFVSRIIIAKRLEEAKENYRFLGGKSPLFEITSSLAQKIESLTAIPTFPVMRYVPPYAETALRTCQKKGIKEIILFSMYPQYSTTTTLSSIKDVQAKCQHIGYYPKIRVVEHYFDHYEYIALLCDLIADTVADLDVKQYDLLLSAHGLPLKIIRKGDPYEVHIQGSVSALKQHLQEANIAFRDVKLVYQSKVGKGAWLEPNLADVLRNPKNRKVVIVPIAFTIDNSETSFELDWEHRQIAQKLHYEDYRVVSCPNDSDRFAAFIASMLAYAKPITLE